jgi:hypothetical protein
MEVINYKQQEKGIKLFTDFNDVDKLTAYAKVLKPTSPPHETIALMLHAMQLGLPTVEGLFYQDGKVGMTSHLLRAMMQRNNVYIRTLKDWEDYRVYNLPGNIILSEETFEQNKDKYHILYSQAEYMSMYEAGIINKNGWHIQSNKQVVIAQVVDKITTIEFVREFFDLNGTIRTTTEVSSWKHSDTVTAGMADKSNHKKYPAQCAYARAFSIGAKRIGADFMYGIITRVDITSARNEDLSLDDIEV